MKTPYVEYDDSDRRQPWVVKLDGRVIFRSGTQNGAWSIANNPTVIQQINAG